MTTMLGIPLEKLNKSKYIRQLRFVIDWLKFKGRATCVGATGFGKTGIAYIILKKMAKNHKNPSSIVIVPTDLLKQQWEKAIESLGILNCKVYVINTIALNTIKYEVDLLVVDEIHKMASEKFIRLFSLVKYKWILGLTATLERLDGKEELLKRFAPVCGIVTHKEAVEKGWVSDTVEINLAVPLLKREIENMADIDKSIRYYMSKFGDYEIMRGCMNKENAKSFAQMYFPGYDPNEKGKEIIKWAIQGSKLIRERQQFLYNTQRKVDVAEELINTFNLKTITFSQSTSFADILGKRLGKKAVVYHSNIESEKILVTKIKKYKTESAAKKLQKSKGQSIFFIKDGEYCVSWEEPKLVGKDYLLKERMRQFKENLDGVSVCCTAKQLDQGADKEDLELGIDAARTSNPTQQNQRRGRVSRTYTYKDGSVKRGIYINLYIPNTRDEGWLRSCQKNSTDVIWLNSVEECISLVNKVLYG